jgi:hypothetical protein
VRTDFVRKFRPALNGSSGKVKEPHCLNKCLQFIVRGVEPTDPVTDIGQSEIPGNLLSAPERGDGRV